MGLGEPDRAAHCFTSELVSNSSALLFISKVVRTAVVLACLDPATILPRQDSWGADGQEGYCGTEIKNYQVLSVVLKAGTGNQSI